LEKGVTMGKSDKWYFKSSFIRIIKAVIIILAIGFVLIGLLLSPKGISDVLKGHFQSGGVLLSFLGFLLMLVSGTDWKPSNEGRIQIFVSLHPTNAMLLIGVICVFLGFFLQALGIEKTPF
jgi:hypothetical protein